MMVCSQCKTVCVYGIEMVVCAHMHQPLCFMLTPIHVNMSDVDQYITLLCNLPA